MGRAWWLCIVLGAVLLLGSLCAAASAVPVDDDDEFEGVAAQAPPPPVAAQSQPTGDHNKAAPEQQPAPTAVPTYAPKTFVDRLRPWSSELLFAVAIATFAITYWYGSHANKERARAWARVMKPVFEEQFSRVDVLRRISPHEFLLYCTGRVHCVAAEVRLHMLARQDVTSLALSLFTAHTDTMTLDIALPDTLAPIVFAICPASKEKRWRDEYDELKLTKARDFGGRSSSLLLLSDAVEVVDLLTPDVVAALEALAPIVQLVYVSDCYERPRCEYRHMAKFVFALRRPGPETEAAARLALRLVDLFATFALSAKGQERAKKKRLQLKSKETHEELSQRAERMREEKLQREKDAIAKLTGAERERAEEKVRKREAKAANKRKMGRVKILKG